MKRWDWMPWSSLFECWVLNQLFTLPFHFHQEALSSSSLSAIWVVPSAYQSSLIFYWQSWPQLVLHPTQRFSWSTLHMLNEQGDNIQPWCTPFLIWNQSVVPCPVLTVACWPAYRFLRRKVRCSGIPISLKNFPQFVVIHTVKGFGVVNKAEEDVFLELSCFSMIQWMLAIWSLVPLHFLNPAWTLEVHGSHTVLPVPPC